MRDRDQVIWDFVQQWLKKAESDFHTAELLLKMETENFFNCVFHCQQSIEKFIKAYLVRHQIEFTKTHDLGKLLQLAERAKPALRSEMDSCVWLSPFGAEFRYLGDYPEATKNTAEKAFNEPQKVRELVLKELKSYLTKGNPIK